MGQSETFLDKLTIVKQGKKACRIADVLFFVPFFEGGMAM